MTSFALTMIWCVVQTSLVAGVSVALAVSLGRFSRGAARSIVCCGLGGMLLLTAMCWSAWPNWNRTTQDWVSENLEVSGRDSESQGDTNQAFGTSSRDSASEQEVNGDARSNQAVAGGAGDGDNQRLSEFNGQHPSFMANLIDELATLETEVQVQREARWPAPIVFFLSIIVGFGLLRFVAGWIGLRRLIRRAERLNDTHITKRVESICATLSCKKSPALYRSPDITSAATVGWSSPIILLPADYQDWTERELDTVLTHEIAHIRHGDFLVAAVAQLSLAVHFYNPLAHWLVRRLRLEMEFDADQAAADSIGSSPNYARTLANMALREDAISAGWPARAFLPTRNTFLRRIEMLRRAPFLSPQNAGRIKWASLTCLMVVMVLAVGLRGSHHSMAAAETTPNEGVEVNRSSNSVTLDDSPLVYIPDSASLVVTIRPADISNNDALKDLSDVLLGQGMASMGIPFDPSQVERLTQFATIDDIGSGGNGPLATVVTFVEPQSTLRLGSADRTEEKTFMLHSYNVAHDRAWMQPDERTLILATEEQIKLLIVSGREVSEEFISGSAQNTLKDAHAGLYIDTQLVRVMTAVDGLPAWANTFSPLWNDTDAMVLGVNVGDEIRFTGTVFCGNENTVGRVEDTIKSALTLARNASRQIGVVDTDDAVEAAMLRNLAEAIGGFLEGAQVEVDDNNNVQMLAEMAMSPPLIAMAREFAVAAQGAALRTQNMNNVKQIMLAMHNYYNDHDHLPPAVSYHRLDSGEMVARSWRIELLPYLEAQDLYDAYRQNEPWDSEHNRALVEQIPPVFQSPGDAREEVGLTSYFVLVGPGSMFGDDDGSEFIDITDGLSNSIAVVEAKRDVPWTKPEDIIWSATEDLPELGGFHPGGFVIGLGDGAARFISYDADDDVIHAMIGISDGIPIDY